MGDCYNEKKIGNSGKNYHFISMQYNINHDHNKLYPLYQNSEFTVSDQFGVSKL